VIERPGLSRVQWIGLSIIVVANAFALGNAGYNRMGEPESRLVLTQRELRIQGNQTRSENSGVSARLRWCVADSTVHAEDATREFPALDCDSRTPDWLNRERLSALGFDLGVNGQNVDEARRYNRNPARPAFLVLEMGGPRLEQKLNRARALLADREAAFRLNADSTKMRREIANMRRRVDWLENGASRLHVIDAGPRLDELRARYPDRARYAILRGQVRARVRRGDSSGPNAVWIGGEISSLDGEKLNVPARYQPALVGVTQRYEFDYGPPAAPARIVEITVAFGKRLEPWIAGVK
jgi:hypothetical protein